MCLFTPCRFVLALCGLEAQFSRGSKFVRNHHGRIPLGTD